MFVFLSKVFQFIFQKKIRLLHIKSLRKEQNGIYQARNLIANHVNTNIEYREKDPLKKH